MARHDSRCGLQLRCLPDLDNKQTHASVDAALRVSFTDTHTPLTGVGAVVQGDSIPRIVVLRQNTVYSPASVNTCDVEHHIKMKFIAKGSL